MSTQKIAFLTANEGIERVELTEPWSALTEAGWEPVLIAPEASEATLFDHLTEAASQPVDLTVSQASVTDYAALVLPGGVANPDALRTDDAAVAFVRDFVDSGRPVAAICHAAWTLVEAGALEGRTLTSWPSLQTDIRNAGGTWVDEQVVTDANLVTSRKPDDLPAFIDAIVEMLAAHSAA
jgi:protease I